jgi:hypothetical protein
MSRIFVSICALAVLGVGSLASAAPPAFGPLPTLDKTKKTDLRFRVVRYDGGTNGKMVVEVRNDGSKAEEFQAKGLYFVPKGDPEKAPQRLGAAGPFKVKEGKKWTRFEAMKVQPNKVVRLELDVFCIDSHRSSPNSKTQFTFASQRMPKKLAEKIDRGTKKLMKAKKVEEALSVKGDVQVYIWKTRDKDWIKLQGERKAEKSKTKNRGLQRRQERLQRRHP